MNGWTRLSVIAAAFAWLVALYVSMAPFGAPHAPWASRVEVCRDTTITPYDATGRNPALEACLTEDAAFERARRDARDLDRGYWSIAARNGLKTLPVGVTVFLAGLLFQWVGRGFRRQPNG